MTRAERAEELELTATEGGLDKILELYRREFPWAADHNFGMSFAEMIEEILDVEYPGRSAVSV